MCNYLAESLNSRSLNILFYQQVKQGCFEKRKSFVTLCANLCTQSSSRIPLLQATFSETCERVRRYVDKGQGAGIAPQSEKTPELTQLLILFSGLARTSSLIR